MINKEIFRKFLKGKDWNDEKTLEIFDKIIDDNNELQERIKMYTILMMFCTEKLKEVSEMMGDFTETVEFVKKDTKSSEIKKLSGKKKIDKRISRRHASRFIKKYFNEVDETDDMELSIRLIKENYKKYRKCLRRSIPTDLFKEIDKSMENIDKNEVWVIYNLFTKVDFYKH